ncbi:MAG: TRAP transporter permease [Atribacterota bacterium]|nr:TRAP transporter permease [Atribacterota bacterium]MDD5637179.1 TRAP transporter permease [Atribacterota bacterium]
MREFKGWQNWLIGGWLVTISIFQLYTAFFGIMQPRFQRGIHLLFLLPIAFILFPATSKSPKDRITFFDGLFAVLAILPPLFLMISDQRLTYRLQFIEPVLTIELVLGVINIILLLEAIRRAVVPAMSVLIGLFFIYLFISPSLPGVFYNKVVPLTEVIEMQYLMTEEGIYGSITGVSATFVALFVIFGAFMEHTRTGEFFTNLACRVAGTSPGGPAKIAVISSGLFGSISGVAAANVYATGTFTIPLMKRMGYRKQFAGAVEAAASTGGMLMPPVMGAGAFVMAEITGISYVKIIVAAALGAILYYISIGMRVHFIAVRDNLKGLSKDQVLSVKDLIRDSYLLIPLVGLVYMLLTGYSPFMAAAIAILTSFAISFCKKETMMNPHRLWSTLKLAGKNMVMIALACAGAGMVVSIVTHTGLGLGIAAVITNWSKGILFPALLLIMLTSLILGMGLPCTPAYIIAITIGGPALSALGCDLLASHLFVFYFAILASVTPPVCIAAYCGAAIAESEPLRTGWEALKLALVGFFIPYVFIYNPALLMQGTVVEIITVFLLLLISTYFLASSLSNFFFQKLKYWQRALIFLIGLFLFFINIVPSFYDTVLAGVLAIMFLIYLVFKRLNIIKEKKKTFLEPSS